MWVVSARLFDVTGVQISFAKQFIGISLSLLLIAHNSSCSKVSLEWISPNVWIEMFRCFIDATLSFPFKLGVTWDSCEQLSNKFFCVKKLTWSFIFYLYFSRLWKNTGWPLFCFLFFFIIWTKCSMMSVFANETRNFRFIFYYNIRWF